MLVDSFGWIEYLADGPNAAAYEKHFLRLQNIATPTIVIYEVYKKVHQTRGEEDALIICAQMEKTKVIDLTQDIAIIAAELSLKLSLPMADAIVYATAKKLKCKVVTSDAHFKNLPDVVFI